MADPSVPRPDGGVGGFRDELRRTCDTLRRATESRLRRRARAGAPTVADEAYLLAQWFADRAADLDGHPADRRPCVPRLGDLACGDVVAVTGRALAEAVTVVGAAADDVAEQARLRTRELRLRA